MTNALLTRVEDDPDETTLVTAAAVDDTVLIVESVADFPSSNGTLELDETTRVPYERTDPDTDTIHLVAPLTAAFPADTKVAVISAGQPVVNQRAHVSLADGGNLVVKVDPALDIKLPIGAEEYADEPWDVVISDDLTTLIAVPGRSTVILGTMQGEFATGSDGDPRVVLVETRYLAAGEAKVEFYSGQTEELSPGYVSAIVNSQQASLHINPPEFFAGSTVARPGIHMYSGTGKPRTVQISGFVDLVEGMRHGSVGTGTFRNSVDARADARIAATGAKGVETITTGAAGSITTKAVTFPAGRFATPPVVTATVQTTRPDLHAVSVQNVTATGFDLLLYRNAGSFTMSVNWIAEPA